MISRIKAGRPLRKFKEKYKKIHRLQVENFDSCKSKFYLDTEFY